MTVGELKHLLEDVPDSFDVDVYVPYRWSGRGGKESGSIVKSLVHVCSKLVEDTLILTTDETAKRVLVDTSKKELQNEMLCDD